VSQPQVRWDARVLDALFASALLGYLAIAHHGRGRGAWVAQEPPAAWVNAVEAALASRREALQALWRGDTNDAGALPRRLQEHLTAACREVLLRLYPQAASAMPAPRAQEAAVVSIASISP
jgi:hypothetical protein